MKSPSKFRGKKNISHTLCIPYSDFEKTGVAIGIGNAQMISMSKL